MIARVVGLVVLWLALLGAAPVVLPLEPPPPDLRHLVQFAQAPLDKPAVVPDVPLPEPPVEVATLPPARVVLPTAVRPMAFLPPTRPLPCVVGSWLRISPSESLECARARLVRQEYDEAVPSLEHVVRAGGEPDLLDEARYWLAEIYYRQGRVEQADWLFRQVAQTRSEWRVWSLHASGWTALWLGDAGRAREAFARALAGPVPAPIDGWARHGLGLASYAVGRHEDAQRAWAELLARNTAPALSRDVVFWHAEASARVGQRDKAVAGLASFVQGGPHPLLDTARLRLGWWALAAGQEAQAVTAFRAYLGGSRSAGTPQAVAATERDYAEAGLARALVATGDLPGARATVAGLVARRSPLAVPVMLRLAAAASDPRHRAERDAIVQDLLAGSLTPPVRAWVLLVKGESERLAGNRDQARTEFELASRMGAGTPIGWEAAFRLARVNFELREFAQAVRDLAPVLAVPAASPELRRATLLLQGEAAYQSGDYGVAAAAFRRALVEFPGAPQAGLTRLAVAWASVRIGRNAEARREFLDFARSAPDDPHAVDALVLATEQSIIGGDLQMARQLLDETIRAHPTHPRTDFARLNRAILLVRDGDPKAAQALRDWLGRAPFPALYARAHAALGVAHLTAGRPGDAAQEFALARREGLTAFADLGSGVAALAQRQWNDAARALTQARDGGTAGIQAAAQYGLAVVAFQRGERVPFKKPALAALAASPSPEATASVLYVLTAIAAEEKDWAGALGHARRLVTEFTTHPAADDGLERVAAAAAAVPAWPVVHDADSLLRQRFPGSPFVAASRLRFARAAAETGRVDQARGELREFLRTAGDDPRAGQAWLLLARLEESAGDRKAALEAYTQASARGGAGLQWPREQRAAHARLLVQARRWDQARDVLRHMLKTDDAATVVEAAHAIGETYEGEGDALAAAEYYLTAAYLAPESPVGRRGLLGAARTLAAAKQADAAAIAYRKLLALPDVSADLALAARQGLAALGR